VLKFWPLDEAAGEAECNCLSTNGLRVAGREDKAEGYTGGGRERLGKTNASGRREKEHFT